MFPNILPLFLSTIVICQQLLLVVINNRKGFWRAKFPRFHTKPSNFCNIQIVIKSQPYTALAENWCPGYLKHALSSSEIHFAVAKSLEIIGHVTNCCKRLIDIKPPPSTLL